MAFWRSWSVSIITVMLTDHTGSSRKGDHAFAACAGCLSAENADYARHPLRSYCVGETLGIGVSGQKHEMASLGAAASNHGIRQFAGAFDVVRHQRLPFGLGLAFILHRPASQVLRADVEEIRGGEPSRIPADRAGEILKTVVDDVIHNVSARRYCGKERARAGGQILLECGVPAIDLTGGLVPIVRPH